MKHIKVPFWRNALHMDLGYKPMGYKKHILIDKDNIKLENRIIKYLIDNMGKNCIFKNLVMDITNKYMKKEDKIKVLKELSNRTIDKHLLDIFTVGQTSVRDEYLYLDRNSYKGKGRPRLNDYTKAQPLFINQ